MLLLKVLNFENSVQNGCVYSRDRNNRRSTGINGQILSVCLKLPVLMCFNGGVGIRRNGKNVNVSGKLR